MYKLLYKQDKKTIRSHVNCSSFIEFISISIVHVDSLTRELAHLMPIEVRCFGRQQEEKKNLSVHGFDAGTPAITCSPDLVSPLDAARRGIDFNGAGIDADLVHCHTWYTHLGGILAKLVYGLPLVITVHSLEPLRPW